MKFDRSLFVGKFSIEAEEHLQMLNKGVLRLERGDADADLIAEILRAAHTLKGSARMMGFKEINQVAHKLEDLLLEVKEGRLKASPALCDLIFFSLDTMDAARQAIVDGQEGQIEVEEVVDLLERAAQGEEVQARRTGHPPQAQEPRPEPATEVPAPAGMREEEAARTRSETAKTPLAAPEPAKAAAATPAPAPQPAPALAPQQAPGLPADSVIPSEAGIQPAPSPARKPLPGTEERIRVSAAKLDKTIRLSGEVIVAQKRAEMRHTDLRQAWLLARDHWRQLHAYLDGAGSQARDGAGSEAGDVLESGKALTDYLDRLVKQDREDVAELSRVVLELQQDTLGLRMLPVSTVFDTFPRAIRDLARERGKEVDLVVQGGETELDKQMLERISDPLMHMLRNAADHGIEPPDEREAAGKPRRGTISLRAYPLGGSIIVEVQDDGRGIDHDAIRRKALQQGLVSEESLRALSDRELQNLIFLSGFSTSQTISDISGRGVGLDVVRRNIIEELKGDISVDTRPGQGTRFTMTLPLTLTTLRILFVRAGGLVFGLPVTYVAETTRVRPQDVIQVVDRQAIRLRDQIVPMDSLADVLHLPVHTGQGDGNWLYMVVAQVADERMAFVVDEVVDEEDVLIKPLPQHMKRIGILSGATIAPDGQIMLILHLPGLLRAVRGAVIARPVAEEVEKEQSPRILVVDDSLNTREIEKSILEASGYQVDLARDGLDALRIIDQASASEAVFYDLLVVDIEMPRMDGLTLTEELRRHEQYARVPIIIVSSRDKEEDRQRGLDVGADAYIVKGTFDQEDLSTTVASLLGRAAP